ncbi:MAG: ferrous iron transport protein A [Fibrobacter sp.]|jgi:ferrous iron transport protein A|nr:ferrous iron transport protein A [Fibrobacter sp.]
MNTVRDASTDEDDFISLADLKPGDKAKIVAYRSGNLKYKSKLLSMGLVRGVPLKVVQVAPLGDPVVVEVLSYRLSLRKKEAAVLKLERVQ